jgi:hypothetical protein
MNRTSDRRRKKAGHDADTMRREYDFSGAVRGVTAARYAEGTNVVVIDPAVLDVFPDGAAVNEALRALAPVLRQRRRNRSRSRATAERPARRPPDAPPLGRGPHRSAAPCSAACRGSQ